MDSRERVVLAIQHREVDRIPTGEIAIAEGVVKESLEVDHVEFAEWIGFVNCLTSSAGNGARTSSWKSSKRLSDPML